MFDFDDFQSNGEQRVRETEELTRIKRLPRRDWRQDPSNERLAALLTAKYRYNDTLCKTKCEGCKAKALNLPQAVFLRELHDLGAGCFAPLAVGSGKTLASFLAAAVIGSPNPLLLVPADQLEKTMRAHQQYSRHWRLPPITVWSYEYLGHPKNLHALTRLMPSLVICDEAHSIKDPSTKAAKRLSKYLRLKNPACRSIYLTGSAAGRSIMEYWHYLRWGLRSWAPLPVSPFEAKKWALALDEKVAPEARYEPGALLQLTPGQTDPRLAYMERLVSSRGVVSTYEDIPPSGLVVHTKTLTLPGTMLQTLEEVRKTWETPDGQSFKLAIELWAHMRTLACGLFMRWDPPAPKEWRDRRLRWHKWVREQLRYAGIIDSAVHLVEELKQGKRVDSMEIDKVWYENIYRDWLEIEPTFEPNSVPTFVDDTVLNYCAEWLEREKGLCWIEQRALGDRLSKMTGIPFFAEQGCDSQGRLIDDYDGPAIVSQSSCYQGHNMQDYHYKNLITNLPPRGDRVQQLYGRTHRQGQPKHEVQVEILITCPESVATLRQVIKDSIFMQKTSGQPVKMLYATREFEDRILEQLNQ